jgi:hypothetical protein
MKANSRLKGRHRSTVKAAIEIRLRNLATGMENDPLITWPFGRINWINSVGWLLVCCRQNQMGERRCALICLFSFSSGSLMNSGSRYALAGS